MTQDCIDYFKPIVDEEFPNGLEAMFKAFKVQQAIGERIRNDGMWKQEEGPVMVAEELLRLALLNYKERVAEAIALICTEGDQEGE